MGYTCADCGGDMTIDPEAQEEAYSGIGVLPAIYKCADCGLTGRPTDVLASRQKWR